MEQSQLPPSIPNPEIGYKFAEQSIKTLLNAYLRLFVPKNLVKISRELGCTIYRIPDIYIKHANLSENFSKLPKSFAKKDSIYFVPECSTPLEFKRIPLQTVLKLQKFREDIIKGFNEDVSKPTIEDETDIEFQKWSIFLQIYDVRDASEKLPTLESLNSFENDKTKVKLMIIGGYQAARGVFYYYKNLGAGDFDTIDILFDEENFCLSLVDTRFPNWKFQKKISFRLEKAI